MVALRGCGGFAASDSGVGSSVPFRAVDEEEAEPIVPEVAESVAVSSELLHDEVGSLGLSVGVAVLVVGKDLVFPLGDGAGQPCAFGNVDPGRPVVEPDQRPRATVTSAAWTSHRSSLPTHVALTSSWRFPSG